jgi:phage terminase small subunit
METKNNLSNLSVVEIKNKVVDMSPQEKRLYKILDKLPRPRKDMNLTRAQKKWWMWFGAEFLATRKLTKVDLMHLQAAAFWMDARAQAYAKINSQGYKGLVQTFKSGATNITGHVSIIEKADKHLNEISAHFGLSIRDRQRMKQKPEENPAQTNLFDDLYKKKYGNL